MLFEIGILIIILGFLLLMAGSMLSSKREENKGSQVKAAGVIFIGPIPIAFGNDRGLLIVVVMLALGMVVLFALMLSG